MVSRAVYGPGAGSSPPLSYMKLEEHVMSSEASGLARAVVPNLGGAALLQGGRVKLGKKL